MDEHPRMYISAKRVSTASAQSEVYGQKHPIEKARRSEGIGLLFGL